MPPSVDALPMRVDSHGSYAQEQQHQEQQHQEQQHQQKRQHPQHQQVHQTIMHGWDQKPAAVVTPPQTNGYAKKQGYEYVLSSSPHNKRQRNERTNSYANSHDQRRQWEGRNHSRCPPYVVGRPSHLHGRVQVAVPTPKTALQMLLEEHKQRRPDLHRNRSSSNRNGPNGESQADDEDDAQNATEATGPAIPLCVSLFPGRPDLILLPQHLTQIAGPAGSGKTQLALQLCTRLGVQQQSSVYLTMGFSGMTDAKLARRIKAILLASIKPADTGSRGANKKAAPSSQHLSPEMDQFVKEVLGRIHLGRVVNPDDLEATLSRKLPELLNRNNQRNSSNTNSSNTGQQQEQQQGSATAPISLVVLDSMANVFRIPEGEGSGASSKQAASFNGFASSKWCERSSSFFKTATKCQKLAAKYNVAFLFLNQVTTRLSSNEDNRNKDDKTPPRKCITQPALGLAWSHCMNATYMITKRQGSGSRSKSSMVATRVLECLKSPHVGREDTQAAFFIDHRGPILVPTSR